MVRLPTTLGKPIPMSPKLIAEYGGVPTAAQQKEWDEYVTTHPDSEQVKAETAAKGA